MRRRTGSADIIEAPQQESGRVDYSLGDSESEQARLVRQIALYCDTRSIRFAAAERVCELGCGAGANLWIAEQVTDGAYAGVDRRETQIQAARSRAEALAIDNAVFRVTDARDTGFEAASFDAVFCRCVLIHQPDPFPVVAEARRLLRPGGRAVFIEPDGPNHYCASNKPNLMKVFHARTELAYGGGRGTPDVARNLYPLLVKAGFSSVALTPHVIFVTGSEPGRCAAFLRHWMEIIAPVADALVRQGPVTAGDLERAQAEAGEVTPDLFICHTMWQADAGN